jgi:hypothetical protein
MGSIIVKLSLSNPNRLEIQQVEAEALVYAAW